MLSLINQKGRDVSMGRKIIAVDFDGTLCMNQDAVNWPYLGQPKKELVEQ